MGATRVLLRIIAYVIILGTLFLLKPLFFSFVGSAPGPRGSMVMTGASQGLASVFLASALVFALVRAVLYDWTIGETLILLLLAFGALVTSGLPPEVGRLIHVPIGVAWLFPAFSAMGGAYLGYLLGRMISIGLEGGGPGALDHLHARNRHSSTVSRPPQIRKW